MPVTDSDVRAYLAARWSRSQPKEAALDHVSEGAWRDTREEVPRYRRAADEARQGTAGTGAAANDNAPIRLSQEIRHAVNGWRFGAAVDAFAAERTEVLAAWDELRERPRQEGEAVALSPAFRQTLDRHAALMKQAASFQARPQLPLAPPARQHCAGQDRYPPSRPTGTSTHVFAHRVTERNRAAADAAEPPGQPASFRTLSAIDFDSHPVAKRKPSRRSNLVIGRQTLPPPVRVLKNSEFHLMTDLEMWLPSRPINRLFFNDFG